MQLLMNVVLRVCGNAEVLKHLFVSIPEAVPQGVLEVTR